MFHATIVTTEEELAQIHQLNQLNLKQNISEKEKEVEGFVSWLYSMELLQSMHKLAPSIIVKDNNKVIGYALVTLRETSEFHADLETMITNLQTLVIGMTCDLKSNIKITSWASIYTSPTMTF